MNLKAGIKVSKSTNTLKVIEETLIRILGNEATRTIFNYLDNHYNLKKEEIPLKMDEFQDHLEDLLGRATKAIMKKIDEGIDQP